MKINQYFGNIFSTQKIFKQNNWIACIQLLNEGDNFLSIPAWSTVRKGFYARFPGALRPGYPKILYQTIQPSLVQIIFSVTSLRKFSWGIGMVGLGTLINMARNHANTTYTGRPIDKDFFSAGCNPVSRRIGFIITYGPNGFLTPCLINKIG